LVSGRFGGQAFRIGASTAQFNTATASRIFNAAGNTTAMSFGFAFRTDLLHNSRCFEVMTLAGGVQCGLGMTSSGGVYFYSGAGGTTICSSAAGLFSTNTWIYIEVELTLAASGGTVTVYVNGASVCSGTGNTLAAGGSGGGKLQIYSFPDTGNSNNDFDDIYVTSGASRLGECKIETLRPASDNTVAWTPSTGPSNYALVNETLVNGDTSFVQTAATGTRDLYGISPLGSTPVNIFAITVVSFAEKTDATTRQLYNSVRSGATDSDGSAVNLAASYGRYDRIIETDPATSAAWTASGVNNLLVGPKAA
jgi:hypothetical protein